MTRVACLFTVLLGFTPCASAQCDCPAEDSIVIGHRGSGSNGSGASTPENTIESAQAALAAGADMVEIDVQLSSDGVLVLMHDDTVDRTTDGSGCVSEMTAEAIGMLDADGVSVPTLEAFFAAVSGGVNVEVKVPEGACPEQDLDATADAVVAAIAAGGAGRQVLVSSFDIEVLRRIRAADASIPIGFLTAGTAGIAMAQAEGFEAVNLIDASTNPRTVEQAHARGLEINVWTVNGEMDVREMYALGVDGVITDTTPAARAALTAVCDEWTCPDAGPPAMDAGVDAGSDGGGDGGCAASPGGSPGVIWLGLLALVAFARRRS